LPLFATAPTGDVQRLFVVQQRGLIRIVNILTPSLGATFLDVSGLLSGGDEQGLLGLAFDPLYATNGRFYIFYTDTNGNIVIARYLVNSSNANSADPSSAVILKTIQHPTNANHNGGMLAFGPDGCLYAATGDGGGSGDPANNAQTTTSLLGKILRLNPETGNACTFVTSNPFANGGGAPEVWSFGLRNPWRFSFDRTTGDLYIGDVGQNCREEVDVSPAPSAGRNINYGWKQAEGFAVFDPSGCPGNTTPPHTPPILDYMHDGGACSITGGYVYRGALAPSLSGTYFYADFCAGFVRSVRAVGGQRGQENSWSLLGGGNITSFGQDANGELYIMTSAGTLSRIVGN
jgi:glucose/arabinose dehydrogenase